MSEFATNFAEPHPMIGEISHAAESTFAEVDDRNRITPAIEFRNVHLSFDDRKVLDNLSFKVMRGETKIILGGSGGGKSTIIKLVLGLLKPDEGRVLVDGEDHHTQRSADDVGPKEDWDGVSGRSIIRLAFGL